MDERLAGARRALVEAPAYLVVERLADYLTKAYGITDVELLQVDYRLAALVPLCGGEPDTHPGSPGWRCFDHQVAEVDGRTWVLPVTVRGDRLGVLRLAPVPDLEPPIRGELVEIATMLAHELAAVRPVTDRYAMAARTRRLTLAAEIQWELLPGRCCIRSAFSLAGQLEPAYAVRGDSFDWADDANRLYLSAINGMGEGVGAAALTALTTHALRNARRAGLALSDQASLADQAVYSRHGGAQHVEALLLDVNLANGTVTAIDAGSPRLLMVRDGQVAEQPLEPQFPLGMFDGSIYQAQRFDLRPGDRMFLLSDGVFDAAAEQTRYGAVALERFIMRTRSLPPLQAVRALLGDLRAFVRGDLVDDAVAVCLDWPSPAGRSVGAAASQ